MNRKILLGSAAFVYYALAMYALFSFEASLLVTSLILFAIPAYFLAHYSAAPTVILVSVATFGAGVVILFEGIAHLYGMWYTFGVDTFRIFGLIPIEVVLTSVVQILFLVLLYELLFDDGEYVTTHARAYLVAFGIFGLLVLLFIGMHQYILQTLLFKDPYIWVIGSFIVATLGALIVQRSLTLHLFYKLCAFTAVAAIPLLISLFLAVTNTHKMYAYMYDYTYNFTSFVRFVPIEELVLVLLFPFFVATFYELYLDDRK